MAEQVEDTRSAASGQGDRGSADTPQNERVIKLGQKLIEQGVIAPDQLEVALREQRRTNKMLGEALVSLGFITESTLAATLSESSGFARFDLAHTVLDTDVVRTLPKEIAQNYAVLPVASDAETVQVAMADVYDVVAICR